MTTTQAPLPVTVPATDDAACIKYRTRLCHNCTAGNFGGTCFCACECPDNCNRKGGSHADPLRPGHKTCKHKNHLRQAVVQQRLEARVNARREADKLAAKVQGNINRLFPAPAAKPIPTIEAGRLAWLELD